MARHRRTSASGSAAGAGNFASASASYAVGRSRQCRTSGCVREYRKTRHSHCCSICSVGRHTARCDAEWDNFQHRRMRAQRRALRSSLTVCMLPGCGRAAGLGHTHCCALCSISDGREHTGQCTNRQQYVHVQGAGVPATGAPVDVATVHNSGAGSSTDQPANATAEAFLSMVHPAGNDDGAAIYVLDSDEEADLAEAVAASLVELQARQAQQDALRSLNFEEMD